MSAHLRSKLGGAALLDGLNEVVATDALYEPGRFAGVALSPQTEAARIAGDVPRLNRLLLQDAYPDLVAAPSAKRVLRFPADRAGQARVAVSLPAGAVVTKAALSAQESLGGDRPDDPGAAIAASGRAGVHVSGDDAAAVSVAVEQALTATGLALPLLALAGDTQVAVELRADDQGAPAGKTLATATASLPTPGAVEWATVHFDPVVLDSGPVWIALRATKGEAVWLAATAADGLHVVRTPDDGAPAESVLPDLQPLYQLLSRSGSAADAPATTLQLDGATLAATRDGDRSTYDLAAALQAHANGGSDGSADVHLDRGGDDHRLPAARRVRALSTDGARGRLRDGGADVDPGRRRPVRWLLDELDGADAEVRLAPRLGCLEALSDVALELAVDRAVLPPPEEPVMRKPTQPMMLNCAWCRPARSVACRRGRAPPGRRGRRAPG